MEQIGVIRSISITNDAELIIAVFDDSRAFDEEDEQILSLIKDKNAIILINKTDLNKNMMKDNDKILNTKKTIIDFSTKEEKGLEKLYEAIEKMFNLNQIENDNTEIITNARQKQQIVFAVEAIKKARNSLEEKMPVDITAICLKEILEHILEITGENVSEEIINEIFKKFCLGK